MAASETIEAIRRAIRSVTDDQVAIEEAIERICMALGPGDVYVPSRPYRIDVAQRNQMIREAKKNGATTRQLARRHQLKSSTIERICRDGR